jgi:hypothetical protein
MTVPLILYENQRLDIRLKTLAVSGGRPKFSASGLGKQGRRAPFELTLPKPDEETRAKQIPAWRSDVQLPLRDDPWTLPRSGPQERQLMEGAERSHFWLYVLFGQYGMPLLIILLLGLTGHLTSLILASMPTMVGNMPNLSALPMTNGSQSSPLSWSAYYPVMVP